ncbi:MAG: amidohydrolase family protein [Actinomycetota bacterium]|nr:amidohydrolase family protein [Actinomycetota bacterium]
MSTDLLIRGATVLDPGSPLRTTDIRIADGVITAVGDGGAPGSARVIDGTGAIATPGLVNAHTHSGQHLDRGVAPNLPLDLWLIWVVYGGPGFDADDAYTLAAAGAIEMLETGCTSVLDHAWLPTDGFAAHAEAIMSAYADVGIRAGLAPMIQDRDIFESMSFEGTGHATPEPLAEPTDPALLVGLMRDFLDRWETLHPLLTPMVGPSAPQRCSDELMAGLAALTDERDALFHTHVLETRTQIVATRRRYGRSIVDVLGDLRLLGPRSSLAHGVWMDADEYAAVRDSGTTIVHNPLSNLRCGSGLLPLGDLVRGDVAVALGADGAASNDNQNMFEAMKVASIVHTLYDHHTRWPTATDVWRACLAGAAALGRPPARITAGAPADLVLLDAGRHTTLDHESLVRSLVLAEHGESVRTVVVDGRVVVEDGQVATVDRTTIDRRARALQQRIAEALAGRRDVYDRYADALAAIEDHAMATPVGVERRAAVTPAFATPTTAPSNA